MALGISLKQSSATPVPKVAAAGVGGLAGTMIIFAAKRFMKVDVPPDVAAGAVAIGAFVVAYFTKDKKVAGK